MHQEATYTVKWMFACLHFCKEIERKTVRNEWLHIRYLIIKWCFVSDDSSCMHTKRPRSVYYRELNKTLASLLSMCFYKIQLNYLLRNPFPDPEITGYYHKDESIIKYSKFPKCVLSFPRLPLQLKTTIWAFSGNTIKKYTFIKSVLLS